MFLRWHIMVNLFLYIKTIHVSFQNTLKITFEFFLSRFLYSTSSNCRIINFFNFLLSILCIFQEFFEFSLKNYLNFPSFEKLFRVVKRQLLNSLWENIWISLSPINFLRWSNDHYWECIFIPIIYYVVIIISNLNEVILSKRHFDWSSTLHNLDNIAKRVIENGLIHNST